MPLLGRSRGCCVARVALALILWVGSSCSSVDVVRLQPDMVDVPEGMEPVAGIQASCLGFYLFTLGIPHADLEKAVNELLVREARKIGAERVVNLQFEGTPGGGIWWLTKLFWFRSASARAIAIKAAPGETGDAGPPPPPPLVIPQPGEEGGGAASMPAPPGVQQPGVPDAGP